MSRPHDGIWGVHVRKLRAKVAAVLTSCTTGRTQHRHGGLRQFRDDDDAREGKDHAASRISGPPVTRSTRRPSEISVLEPATMDAGSREVDGRRRPVHNDRRGARSAWGRRKKTGMERTKSAKRRWLRPMPGKGKGTPWFPQVFRNCHPSRPKPNLQAGTTRERTNNGEHAIRECQR